MMISLSISIQTTQCHGEICLPKNHVALFIFADSVVDAGNNNYINTTTDFQANYSPYGENFFRYPTGVEISNAKPSLKALTLPSNG